MLTEKDVIGYIWNEFVMLGFIEYVDIEEEEMIMIFMIIDDFVVGCYVVE